MATITGAPHGQTKTLSLTLNVWRQSNATSKGRLESYKLNGVSTEMSFFENSLHIRDACHRRRKGCKLVYIRVDILL